VHRIGITRDLLQRCAQSHYRSEQHRPDYFWAGLEQGLEMLQIFNVAAFITISAGNHLPGSTAELQIIREAVAPNGRFDGRPFDNDAPRPDVMNGWIHHVVSITQRTSSHTE
tara:strand:- start:32 stop:367 length:336 start_codon:yes stop_codon:yes gene_type:complete